MKSSLPPPTKAQAARMDKLTDFGCVACYLNGFTHKTLAEVHHYLSGNKRISHDATVPLCTWHHQGTSTEAAPSALLRLLGPSFHKHTRQFRARYGSDSELLETVNRLLEGK